MALTDLQNVADTVVSRAKRQGYVLPREIREHLEEAGGDGKRWKELVALAGPRLALRKGRYYFVSSIVARMRQDHRLKLEVTRAVRQLIRTYRTSIVDQERRAHRRIHFIKPVQVVASDGQTFNLISQDISLSGIRLVGTCDLRGQKVRIRIPSVHKAEIQWCFSVQILWSVAVGDQLIENGGIFLGLSAPSAAASEDDKPM